MQPVHRPAGTAPPSHRIHLQVGGSRRGPPFAFSRASYLPHYIPSNKHFQRFPASSSRARPNNTSYALGVRATKSPPFSLTPVLMMPLWSFSTLLLPYPATAITLALSSRPNKPFTVHKSSGVLWVLLPPLFHLLGVPPYRPPPPCIERVECSFSAREGLERARRARVEQSVKRLA